LMLEVDVRKRKNITEVRKMLEEQYFEVIGQMAPFKEPEAPSKLELGKYKGKMMRSLLWIVKMDLENQHKGLFGFEKDKTFSIKVLHENW